MLDVYNVRKASVATRLPQADLLLMPLTVSWRDGLAWQPQSSVQTLPSSLHKVFNEHVEGECLEIILILEIDKDGSVYYGRAACFYLLELAWCGFCGHQGVFCCCLTEAKNVV